MQKERRDQRVFQHRHGLSDFHAHTRFAEPVDDQPSSDDEIDPTAQRPVKPRNTERLGPLAFLLR